MRRLLFFFLFMTLCLRVSGQRELTSDGEVIAHGISRMGVMPTSLRELIGGRTLVGQDEHRSRRIVSRGLRRGIMEQTEPVAPLLHSIRDQEAPYNLLCPRWTYEDGTVSEEHTLSGCVATAIEQVIAYYRYPEALRDTLHGWQTDHYSLQDLLPGTRFDWQNYLLDYRDGWTEQQGLAIALPTLAVAMAVHMNFGLESSGASVYRAVEPLESAFGYGMVRYLERILYTPQRWHRLLQHELRHGRPVVYVGHNMGMGGHAFNIDGVDDRGYYHVNWGYNGSYDGWYDLDWLTPWAMPAVTDSTDFIQGFFCNQGALLMHPSAASKPLEPDTLELDRLGVELREVTFLRQPDIRDYVAAEFRFCNTGPDSVTYTYEVMSFLPTDTAVFEQADYVGLAGLTLAPQEERVQRVYLHFSHVGERILGISHDDVTIPFTMPISVENGTRAQLEWGSASVVLEAGEAGTVSATVTVPVENTAPSGYSGAMLTCSLNPDGVEEKMRHYPVLSLPGGQRQDVSVTFSGLQPATHYSFSLRYPWTIQVETDFVTPVYTRIESAGGADIPGKLSTAYDLCGRPADTHSSLVLRSGNKYLRRWNR